MITRDSCYFCTSTYQLLSIISLAATRGESADLYIDPQFKDAVHIAEHVEELKLFECIKVIDADEIYRSFFSHRRGLLNHLEIARSYLLIDKIAQMILEPGIKYNNMFISSRAYMPRMVQLFLIKHGINTKVNYFEDGIGSYLADHSYAPRMSDAILRKMLFGKSALLTNHDRYLFSPEIFRSINKSSKCGLFKIDNIFNEPEWLNAMNKVFGYDESEQLKERTVIIDEPLKDMLTNEQVSEVLGAYRTVLKYSGQNDTVLKLHPRTNERHEIPCAVFQSHGVPFEVVCMNNNVSDSVLVTFASTAVATPRILLHQEPYIILLYNILSTPYQAAKSLDDFFYSISKDRIDKKVFLPNDMEELVYALNIIYGGRC